MKYQIKENLFIFNRNSYQTPALYCQRNKIADKQFQELVSQNKITLIKDDKTGLELVELRQMEIPKFNEIALDFNVPVESYDMATMFPAYLTALHNRINDLQTEKAELENKLQTSVEAEKAAITDILSISEKLADLETEMKDFVLTINRLEAYKEQLSHERQEYLEMLNTANTKLEQTNIAQEESQEEIEMLRSEINNSWKWQVEKQTEELKESYQEISDKDREINSLHSEINLLKIQIGNLNHENEFLRTVKMMESNSLMMQKLSEMQEKFNPKPATDKAN